MERSSDWGSGSGGLLGYPLFIELYFIGLGAFGTGLIAGGFSASSVIDVLSGLYREDDAIGGNGAVWTNGLSLAEEFG